MAQVVSSCAVAGFVVTYILGRNTQQCPLVYGEGGIPVRLRRVRTALLLLYLLEGCGWWCRGASCGEFNMLCELMLWVGV